jgi:hypothetical protein
MSLVLSGLTAGNSITRIAQEWYAAENLMRPASKETAGQFRRRGQCFYIARERQCKRIRDREKDVRAIPPRKLIYGLASLGLAVTAAGAVLVSTGSPAAVGATSAMTVVSGTYSCGPVVGRPPMTGKITWSPPYPKSGIGAIGVIRFSFTAHECSIVSGPKKGGTIRTVRVSAAFPVKPNACPFLPPTPNYIENLTLTYPGTNWAPSYATVQVNGAAYWTFTAGSVGGATTGLVGGSFATTGATAKFRPILTIPTQTCTSGVSSLTLAPDPNNLIGF